MWEEFVAAAEKQIKAKMKLSDDFLSNQSEESTVLAIRKQIGEEWRKYGGSYSPRRFTEKAAEEALKQLHSLVEQTKIFTI